MKYKLKNMLSYLCSLTGTSRSGYYRYFSEKGEESRRKHEQREEELRKTIQKAYDFKRRKKGAKQIKMTLAGQFKIVMNLKCIRRIMKKYHIVCPYRKPSPVRKALKATLEHAVVPNRLNRNFRQGIPGMVLLTDITYVPHHSGRWAYLSTIKDASTSEILAHNLSYSLEMPLVTNTLKKLMATGITFPEGAFIHSDQGSHYTSPIFQNMVKSIGLGQSMSRKGNCWDNAPQESFYGHFKDEAELCTCRTSDALEEEIDDYIDYYNNFRYQWDLKKMTPAQYRDHLLSQL
jgi:transposase InsO family protein